jgi:hypothetical protein
MPSLAALRFQFDSADESFGSSSITDESLIHDRRGGLSPKQVIERRVGNVLVSAELASSRGRTGGLANRVVNKPR